LSTTAHLPRTDSGPAHGRARRPSVLQRWPDWVGYAAALWSLAYGLLGVYWSLGGRGFPFGVENDPEGARVSILEGTSAGSIAPVIAALGLLGAIVALVMARARSRGRLHLALAAFAWAIVALAVVIPDSRPLMAVARTPIVLGGMPFGWPEGVGFFEPGMFAWPVANQLLIMLGGALWAAATLAYRSRTRAAAEVDTGWTSAASAARWGRWTAAVAIVVPVLYASTRWAWAAGIPLGVTPQFLRDEARDTPDIWLAGALLATVAVVGAILTLGLVQRWGEVYPRWLPYLRGRPVRPRTAIVPASVAAALILTAGIQSVRAQVLGHYPEGSGLGEENWGTTAPGLLWPLWGSALGATVLAYYLRRRCPGRGPIDQAAPSSMFPPSGPVETGEVQACRASPVLSAAASP
jgi:hypothetical protein